MNGDKDWKEPFYSREDVPPILETPKYWLLNVLRDDLIWLCPVDREGTSSTSGSHVSMYIDTGW